MVDETPLVSVKYYCINYKDDNRKTRIIRQFQKQNIEIIFIPEVDYTTDLRFTKLLQNPRLNLRNWAIMMQHMDSIRHFAESSDAAEYCIICEDDILLCRNFAKEISHIIRDYNVLQLDILLLGYLLPYKITDDNGYFPLKLRTDAYSYYDFPQDLWGSQMYLISKRYATVLIEKYTLDYAVDTIETTHFSPDWTITKCGNKSVIYPMLALEDGESSKAGLEGETSFHRRCFANNYTELRFDMSN